MILIKIGEGFIASHVGAVRTASNVWLVCEYTAHNKLLLID